MHPILLFLTAIVCCCVAVRQQSVGVVGRLMCGDKPAAGVKVKLWDEDDGPDPDDLLDQGFTDAKGEFSLKGSERETTNIDPVFKVYHVTRSSASATPTSTSNAYLIASNHNNTIECTNAAIWEIFWTPLDSYDRARLYDDEDDSGRLRMTQCFHCTSVRLMSAVDGVDTPVTFSDAGGGVR
ncbi:hypothetical protein RB195_005229 [Necator americanus]|uniref:Transthyretin-like family protein n=1 Tax=Necator americanus TaxID=51031 RepID=A0ABR1BQQ4_NECAM